ncbi:MarR family winged helix-turn-helix transcriptional regulator [Bacillus tuaregi]|uniref:MarR family winged helix-turn-helix transcriptional regulator n=1 Tax=Bacillus tuaregi TaxID=1816695 RepID=UPI0008F8D44B|nr:MarR family transcriptional regulator [Bacillus tuaregi]
MSDEQDFNISHFLIEDALGSIINRAAIIVKKRLHLALKEAGLELTPEEFALLSRLWESDGIPQTELVEKTLKDKTRVTRLLGGLMNKSYVIKKTDENDRRNYNVHLTEEGKRIRSIIIPIVIQLMKEATEGIEQEEIDMAKSVLRKVFLNLNSISTDKE